MTLTQNAQILSYLKQGHGLTPMAALKRFGSLRLGARVWDLKRKGHIIHKTMIPVGKRKRVARYTLIQEAPRRK